jgi:hypothetical protein
MPPTSPEPDTREPLAAGPLPVAIDESEPGTLGQLVPYIPSWLVSLVIHLLFVLLLATWTTLLTAPETATSLDVSTAGEDPLETTADLDTASFLSEVPADSTPEALAPAALEPPELAPFDPGPLLPITTGELDAGLDPVSDEPLRLGDTDGLGQRISETARKLLVEAGGGNERSEAAVQAALNWLARHQMPEGYWSFHHDLHPDCRGKCDHAGRVNSNTAATAIALLPFLGTGQTHVEGTYRDNVRRGLTFLINSIRHERDYGSLWDPQGNMYGHGLASIVLCEAYAMTGDQNLRSPAQAVLDFIVDAQDPKGGGWRYQPRMPGDTSVVGWQLMALKSGRMGELRVPTLTFRRTTKFLNFVEADDGAAYGYDTPNDRRPATTAIGLLCRMYLGWTRSNRTLQRGIELLDKEGPSVDKAGRNSNLYYNYYGTQVMHHWGGEPWHRWNLKMRDFLIDTQAKEGHASGSWYFDGDHGSGSGGRLYCTAMSAMILEVYYRHLPIYGQRSIEQ